MPVNVDRKIIFDAVKRLRGGAAYSTADVAILDAAIDAAIREVPAVEPAAPPTSPRFALSQANASVVKKLIHPFIVGAEFLHL